MRFYEKLTQIITHQGFSKDDVMNHVMVSPLLLDGWLDGTKLPDYDQIIKLSHLFGLTYEELVGEDIIHIVKPKTSTRIYNVDSHYSGLSLKIINIFNIGRMLLITSLMILILLTILEIPNDPLLQSLIVPYSIALILTILYGYLSLHERKFFKIRSIQFIKHNRIYRTSATIRFTTLFILVGFITYFWLNTLRDFASESILLYSVIILILSISINLLSWIFYQSITTVTVDVFQYNLLHELTYPYHYTITLENGKKADLTVDQINFSYSRIIYNGIEYFQKHNTIYRVMKNSSIEIANDRTYIVGEEMLTIKIVPRFLLPPKINFPQAKKIHFVKPIYKVSSFTIQKLIYALGIFFLFSLLL